MPNICHNCSAISALYFEKSSNSHGKKLVKMEKDLVQHYSTNKFPQSLVHKKISTCRLGIDSYGPYQSCTSPFQLDIGKSTAGEHFVWKTQSIHYRPKYHSAFQNLYRRKPHKVGYFVLRCLYCLSKIWAAMAVSFRPHLKNVRLLWLKLLYPSKNLKWEKNMSVK